MNKKILTLLVLFTIICFVAVFATYKANISVKVISVNDNELGLSIMLNAYEEVIYPYYNAVDDTYYFFVPAWCNTRLYNSTNYKYITVSNEKIGKWEFFEWTDGDLCTISYGDAKINVVFVKLSDIASFFISTESGSTSSIDEDKLYSEKGEINVIEVDGHISYSGGLTIKGRGNSTFRWFSKKPYNIKLDNAAMILGMELEKDFCMLANSWDYSYMNNKLAFDMAEKAGFDYVPEAEYVDVFFNGNYWGLYLVTEKIEVDSNRIDITDLEKANEMANNGMDISKAERFDFVNKRGVYLKNNPSDITGGYLIERDYRLNPGYGYRIITPSYFETEDFGSCFNIKSPEYASREEVNYISTLTNEMEQAILSIDGYSETGKYYLDYIDLDSWVKWYMIAEIAYDLDKDVTNTYYYKDRDMIDSKFYAGPVWDYDCRFGGSSQYSYPNILTKLSEGNGWDQHLYEKQEFFDGICGYWISFFEEYLRVDAQLNINIWQEQIRKSVSTDNIRWNRNEGYPVVWPGSDNGENFINVYVFDDQVDHLRKWLEERRVFLNEYWNK